MYLDPITLQPVDDLTQDRKPMLPRARSAGNTLTNSVQPGQALPMTMRQRLGKIADQLDELDSNDVDTSALQAYAKQQGQAGDAAMLNALAAQFAGENFQPVQTQYLKRALAAQEPMKVGQGMLTPDGQYIKDPFAARDTRRASLERQYNTLGVALDRQEARDQARQDRLDKIADDQRYRNDRAVADERYRRDMIELRRDAIASKSEPGSFTHEGFTPDNKRVVTNSKSGASYVLTLNPDGTPNYAPYGGSVIPKSSYEKEVSAATEALASAKRSDDIIQKVEANPEAFGIGASLVSMLPNAVQGRVGNMVLNSETMKTRSDVLRQAAQEINQLYGAALSAGESARAATFIPDAKDPPELIIQKLKAARDWAYSNASKHGTAIRQSAESRGVPSSQGNNGSVLSADEQAEYERLKKKYGR